MFAADTLTLDAPQRTSAGFLAVRAKAARTGVYDYAGHEVDPQNEHGLRDTAVVKVLRDENTVFDKASVASFIGKPITNDHPAQPVTASNWRDYARGTIMNALRDGEHLAFDLLLTDQAAIDAVDAGKRELSNGYATELEFGSFTAADGTACQARQTNIAGNHIALVDKGRAGADCRISDSKPTFAVCDANPARVAELSQPKEDRVKVINLDGMSVNLSDATAAEQAIATLDTKLTAANDAKAKVDTDLATAVTDKANLEAKVTTLEKQIEDSKVTPAQLRDAAKVYAGICDKAKVLGVTVADDANGSAVMKAVVDAKIGDAAKDWSEDQVAASFATLTADAKPAVQSLNPIVTADAMTARDTARNDYIARMTGQDKDAA